MALMERIAQVEAAIVSQRATVTEEIARLRGLEAELEALRTATGGEEELSELARTDAILAILRQSSASMSPTELLQSLQSAGRTEDLRSITATLDYLLKAGSVERPSRGRYLPV